MQINKVEVTNEVPKPEGTYQGYPRGAILEIVDPMYQGDIVMIPYEAGRDGVPALIRLADGGTWKNPATLKLRRIQPGTKITITVGDYSNA